MQNFHQFLLVCHSLTKKWSLGLMTDSNYIQNPYLWQLEGLDNHVSLEHYIHGEKKFKQMGELPIHYKVSSHLGGTAFHRLGFSLAKLNTCLMGSQLIPEPLNQTCSAS